MTFDPVYALHHLLDEGRQLRHDCTPYYNADIDEALLDPHAPVYEWTTEVRRIIATLGPRYESSAASLRRMLERMPATDRDLDPILGLLEEVIAGLPDATEIAVVQAPLPTLHWEAQESPGFLEIGDERGRFKLGLERPEATWLRHLHDRQGQVVDVDDIESLLVQKHARAFRADNGRTSRIDRLQARLRKLPTNGWTRRWLEWDRSKETVMLRTAEDVLASELKRNPCRKPKSPTPKNLQLRPSSSEVRFGDRIERTPEG